MSFPGDAEDWPNRGPEILGSTLSICILSVLILGWRVVLNIVNKRRLLLHDYLLIIAALLNIASAGIRIKSVIHGQGRHIQDPTIIKPHDLMQYSYFLWIGQNINLIAVTILKWSICAYLLALPFGLVYKIIIWASVVMVLVFNFILPTMGNFGCRPFEKNWNRGFQGGSCFYKAPPALTYSQGVSNIITDIIYVIAPIIYLSKVQLTNRTQWGVRFVFCLGLIATICSIFKTVELRRLLRTRDPTWDGVELTIWSATELSVGIIVASLPSLRKEFEKILRKVLPTSMTTTSNKNTSSGIAMYNVSRVSKRNTKIMGRSDIGLDDGDSERSILPEGAEAGITKTVVHEVTSEASIDQSRKYNGGGMGYMA